MPRLVRTALGALAVMVLAACSTGPTTTPPAASTASPSAGSPSPSHDAGPSTTHPTVWLCRPGMHANPCRGGLDAVAVHADGTTTNLPFRPAAHPPIDCFYVYPTVSQAKTDNAPLRADAAIIATARAQAARFASVCRVFAPVYRQATVAALLSGRFFDARVRARVDSDIRSAWQDYLAHFNHGRGVVLIGHSQGAMALTRLIATEIDGNATERRLLVAAILLGGNVTTAVGRDVGGSFQHVPVCTTSGQLGCVVAYSSFSSTPPAMAFFGRTVATGQHVVCTDPSRLAGGAGALHPYLPTDSLGPAGGLGAAVPTPHGSTAGFTTYPGYLTARCRTAVDAVFLEVKAAPAAGRPTLPKTLGPAWGLHVEDVNLALGDLVTIVRRQAATWTAAH